MIVSLLVTGYVFYLYFKLKAEKEAIGLQDSNSVAELKSAILELNSRVENLLSNAAAPRNKKGAPPC